MMTLNLIKTARLFIRNFTISDQDDLYEYLSNPAIYKFEPGKPITHDEAKELTIERSKGNDFYAVVLKANNKMIGHLYFKQIEPKRLLTWEIGYIFNPRYYRNGYASEAAAAMTEYSFKNLETHRIMARCNPDNIASWKLLEKIGYIREGHFKKFGFIHRDSNNNPIWTDVYEYSKIRK